MEPSKIKIVVVDDVLKRDGIGIEVYDNDEMVLEIFRDDTQRTRTITAVDKCVSLDLIEEAIKAFKREIPWDFIDYDDNGDNKDAS